MDILVFLAVLTAAAAHAGWNALIKGAGDPLVMTAVLSFASGIAGVALLTVTGLPPAAVWPWLVTSIIVHVLYFASLVEAYRYGDLSQVYPIARGGAPLLTAIGGWMLIGEDLSGRGWSGLVLLVCGVFLLSFGNQARFRVDPRGVRYAGLTALTICAYTLLDGIGARLSGNAPSYVAALFIGCAIATTPYFLWRGGKALLPAAARHWRLGAVGGGLQLVSYGVVVWAMTMVPIALVAALRETSVLFASLISVAVLKESLSVVRVSAAIVIVVGLMLLRLS
jgi:drug/metabolite transporter (DMT)-like permease